MRSFLIVMLVLSLALVVGCQPAPDEVNDDINDEINDEANDQVDDAVGPLMGLVDAPPAVDGSSEGYTADALQVAGASILLAHDGSSLYVHMETEVDGWVSIGFNTLGGTMDGANMVLGYLDNGDPAYRDDVGRGLNHSEAGTAAVEDFYLSYEDGSAVMEFSYPLDFPGDEGYSMEELVLGETYTLIVASNNNSHNIAQRHSNVGRSEFTVEQ